MAGNSFLRMKRKDLEEANDDFLDFTLSSPATKIRRLDAELPLVMEEEARFPLAVGVSSSGGSISSNVGGAGGLVIEELPSVPANEERAIVLFNPRSTPSLETPSNFSVSVSSDLISGIKNQVYWSNQFLPMKLTEEEASRVNECMAVVPWVSSQLHPTENVTINEISDSMEAEEMEVADMDIEENNPCSENGTDGTNISEGLHQWQQQHCMIQQLPSTTSTPLVWYR